MNRTRALGLVLAAAALAAGLSVLAFRWRAAPTFECPPDRVRLDTHGVAQCDGPGALPAGQALTLGQKLDLNHATAQSLGLIPGIPPDVARALVAERARLGAFSTWDQVDAVEGVGPARLETLQSHCVFGAVDGGV